MEPLEPRLMLDSNGFISGNDVYLTLSFAGDGTAIADQTSSLAARFDAIAPTSVWQDAILRAFQTWAVETNGDIGVVSDSGDPFGSPGPSQDDGRFGDIRIGAIAMSSQVGAVSVPVDGLVSGTWFADVVFNIDYNYVTVDDIYAIALHEAGNVFGLEDSSDPNSPLFTGGTPTGLPPTATDLATLHQLHGFRSPDFNEPLGGSPPAGNDSFANATRLKLGEAGLANEGTAPSILYGDLTNDLDVDFFELKTPGDYTGPATIQVRSSGISLLAPTVSLYDATQQLLSQAVSTSSAGDVLTFSIPTVSPDETYYIKVAGSAPGLFGIGGFSLVATFDGINQISQAEIDSIAGGQFRFLEQDEISKFFDTDENEHFGDDAHTDDTPLSASGLKTTTGFLDSTHYEVIASIADAIDVDFFSFKSPDVLPVPLDVMTVIVRSIDAGGLVPVVSVFDENGLSVPSTILANGAGEYIVQVTGVSPNTTYQVKVEASDSSGPFNTGNYSFTATFGSQATQLVVMSTGVVGNGTTQNNHTLHIGRPQLFHLALQIDPVAVNSPTAVVATIKNDAGDVVYQIAAAPGDTRSREAVFLAAGTYTVEIIPFTLDGSVPPALSYSLLGAAISDPFVGDPNDPTNNPFACTTPGMENLFCYPGGFVSEDPFLWDSFIDSITDPPQIPNLPQLITFLFGDWWTWVWNQTGINGPPFSFPDAIQVQEASSASVAPLLLGPSGSVLDNDIDPENDPLVAILQSGPSHGLMSIAPDGTFVYTPNVGFSGRDEFTYTAYDFSQESASTTVSIIVGISGDFSADGAINGSDFLSWQRSFGTATGAVLTDGDSDFDGDVDPQDLATWEQSFGLVSIPSGGDANGDGDFDGSDFLAWQRGFGASSGAFPSDGDADADRDVDNLDLVAWQGNFGTTIAGAVAASSGNIASPIFVESPAQVALSTSQAVLPPEPQINAVSTATVTTGVATNVQPDSGRLALADNKGQSETARLNFSYATAFTTTPQQVRQRLVPGSGKQLGLSTASQNQKHISVKPVINRVPVPRSEYDRLQTDVRDRIFTDFYENRLQLIRTAMLDALGGIGEELDAG